MGDGLTLAAAGAFAAGWLVLLVAVVWVLLYRAAFPRGSDPEPADVPAAAAPPPDPSSAQPVMDSRPRRACPGCGELVLVDARLCRFCGHRFAEKLG